MRNSLLVEQLCAENERDSSMKPKLQTKHVDVFIGRGALDERLKPEGNYWWTWSK